MYIVYGFMLWCGYYDRLHVEYYQNWMRYRRYYVYIYVLYMYLYNNRRAIRLLIRDNINLLLLFLPAGYVRFPFSSFWFALLLCGALLQWCFVYRHCVAAAYKFNVANVILCCSTAIIWLFFGLLIGCKVNGGTSLFWLNELVECCECILGKRRGVQECAYMGDGDDAMMCIVAMGAKKLWTHRTAQSNKKGNRVFIYGWPLQSVFYYLFSKSIVKQILYMLERCD